MAFRLLLTCFFFGFVTISNATNTLSIVRVPSPTTDCITKVTCRNGHIENISNSIDREYTAALKDVEVTVHDGASGKLDDPGFLALFSKDLPASTYSYTLSDADKFDGEYVVSDIIDEKKMPGMLRMRLTAKKLAEKIKLRLTKNRI